MKFNFQYIFFIFITISSCSFFENKISSINIKAPSFNILQKKISFETSIKSDAFITYWIKGSDSIYYSSTSSNNHFHEISLLYLKSDTEYSFIVHYNSGEKKLKSDTSEEEIYVSHIIYQQLLDGHKFKTKEVDDYCDWGTLKDWNNYRSQYKTIFIDLDGVLVESSSEYFPPYWGTTGSIKENVATLNELYESGKVRIIITTSRKSSYKIKTIKQLELLGIKYHDIIFDLLHCERILINDYSKTNPYPTAKSCNLFRNSNQLGDLLK